MRKKSLVSIIMGSQTDLKIMKKAAECLELFQVPHEIEIISAHRTPEKMVAFANTAIEKGIKVIIAGAGGAAHLPGMVASLTTLPVIGVPIEVGNLDGLDALLSIAQMPKGVPVATVAIGNGFNAGLLAVRILSLSNEKLGHQLLKYRKSQKKLVAKMNQDHQLSKAKK